MRRLNQSTDASAPQSFGAWLRGRRKELALTQTQVAQRAGCTAATIRKLEADERKPSWQLAELLATALAVPDGQRMTFLYAARQVQMFSLLSPVPPLPAIPTFVPSSSQPFIQHLPAPMTSLVARIHDSAHVVRLLTRPDVRLLTLLGPPGIGKTRLAIHCAEVACTHFRQGVWFVDLASLTDAAQVLPAIAYTLSVAAAGATPLLDRLCATLADQQLLLLLDNCEQVSAAAGEIAMLLRRCRGLTVVATSRTPLRLSAEYEYNVPPLTLPPPVLENDPALESLMSYESIQLFVARAQQHQHSFAITPANSVPIVKLCRQLEGIPLALELAAAALRRMTVEQLAELLQSETEWLHHLHSPAQDLPPRHRTLYHAIAWSYKLLESDLQRIFRQLGIFVGGFTAQAARAVCGADLVALAQLTEHNLLVHKMERWQMLEMVSEFALNELNRPERSYERREVYHRFTAFFGSQAAPPYAVQPALQMAQIAADYDNFCAALKSTVAGRDGLAALTICSKLGGFWENQGYLLEGMKLTRAVLAMPEAQDAGLRLEALERISILAWQAHQFDVALAFAEQTRTLAQANRQPETLARALNLIGRVFLEQGDYERAESVLQECMQLSQPIAHLFNPGCPLTLLGEVALACGERKRAAAYLSQALTALADAEKTLYNGLFVATAHTDLAELALLQENVAPNHLLQARHELRQALPYARLTVRRLRCLLVALTGLLLTALPIPSSSTNQAAVTLLGAIAGLGERTGDALSPFHQRLIADRSASAQRILPQVVWQAAWQAGYAWTLAQAAAEAERWLVLDGTQ